MIGNEGGVKVEKTTKHIIVWCESITGEDSDELLLQAKSMADRVAASLEAKYGFRLGEGRLIPKKHIGVYDPAAELLSKRFEVSDDIGKIDRSEGMGEIEFFTAEAAKDYLLMSGNIRGILAALNEFAEGMRDHRAMIQEIRELVEELRRQNKRV